MLSESLPQCLCGYHHYDGGGGSLGGEIAYTLFKCTHCGRRAFVLEGPSELLLLDTRVGQDGKLKEDYINNILITAIRASREAKEPHVVPPQLPDCITAFYREPDGQWNKVDHLASRKIPVPPDPVRVYHDKFWGELLEKLQLSGAVHEIPNRYYDDRNNLEPWYEMRAPEGQILRFGPRKHVLAIQVTGDAPFECEGIAKAAKKDNVTFNADNQWQPWDQKKAKDIEVHAYGKEKFVSYFGWIMWDLGRTMGHKEKKETP